MAINYELDGVGQHLRGFLSKRPPVILSDEVGDTPNSDETLKKHFDNSIKELLQWLCERRWCQGVHS